MTTSKRFLAIATGLCLAATAASANVLVETDFETTANWYFWDGASVESWAGYSGGSAGNGMIFAGWSGGGGFYQDYASSAVGEMYTFTIYGGPSWDWDRTGADIEVYIDFLDSGFVSLQKDYITPDNIGLTDDWGLQTVIATSPANTAIVRVGANYTVDPTGSGAYRFDDASLVATAIPEPGTIFLMATGAIGLVLRRRRSR
jgi:hypothetical protein